MKVNILDVICYVLIANLLLNAERKKTQNHSPFLKKEQANVPFSRQLPTNSNFKHT